MSLIDDLRVRRDEVLRQAEAIYQFARSANRELTGPEAARADKLMSEIEGLDSRIEDLADAADRQAASSAYFAGLERRSYGSAARTSPPRTYNEDAERRGLSFLRDVYEGQLRRDPGALERLQRHQQEVAADLGTEYRDVGMGAFTGLVVPQYLTDLVAPLRRAGRPVADICNKHPLPPDGMTVNISRITTGSAVAVQATENTAVQETNMDDTLLTVDVRTIAGMQDVSRQAIERGTGVDAIVIADLARAYNTELDNQILNGSGASGEHRGIRNVTGIVSVTYTDATPSGAELYPKLADLAQQIQAGTFLGVDALIFHPRRWWWLAKDTGSTFPFLQLSGIATQAGGLVFGTNTYERGPAGNLVTMPVVLDGNVPTNLGGGINEDIIIGVTTAELHLWEDSRAPLLLRSDEALSNQLSVRFVLYGYSAFTAGRYPGAHGTISGTGLVTPTFA